MEFRSPDAKLHEILSLPTEFTMLGTFGGAGGAGTPNFPLG